MKRTRLARIALGAMTLMVPASAYASAGSPTVAPAQTAGTVTTAATGGATANTATKARRHHRPAARFAVRPRTIEALGGQVVHVHGRLLPGFTGARVRLQGLFRGQWNTIGSSRTGGHGGFDVHYATSGTGQHRLRVLFSGNRRERLARAGAGTLTVFSPAVASWYEDGGQTACGFHAQYGVANKTLPCGTKVVFAYHGRTVTATVDDRGPFVAGRDWDLSQTTAGALGFGGVDTVWASVQ
jgi:hypothetical protein